MKVTALDFDSSRHVYPIYGNVSLRCVPEHDYITPRTFGFFFAHLKRASKPPVPQDRPNALTCHSKSNRTNKSGSLSPFSLRFSQTVKVKPKPQCLCHKSKLKITSRHLPIRLGIIKENDGFNEILQRMIVFFSEIICVDCRCEMFDKLVFDIKTENRTCIPKTIHSSRPFVDY